MRLLQTALAKCGIALAESRKLTLPEVESYLGFFNGRPGDSSRSGATKRYIPTRRKPKP